MNKLNQYHYIKHLTKPKSGASDINNKKIMIIIIIIIIITLDKVTLIQTSSVRHEYNHDDEMPCTAAKTSYENHQQILLWCSHNTDEIQTQYLRIFVSYC